MPKRQSWRASHALKKKREGDAPETCRKLSPERPRSISSCPPFGQSFSFSKVYSKYFSTRKTWMHSSAGRALDSKSKSRRFKSGCVQHRFRDSIVASIPACHAGDRGSIPRRGGKSFTCCYTKDDRAKIILLKLLMVCMMMERIY